MSDTDRMDTAALLRKLLADDKLEIRQLASTTLSGLLQCLEERFASTVRDAIMADATRLFPLTRRRGAAAEKPSKEVLTQSHACVLGLRAVLLSRPYEISSWCAHQRFVFQNQIKHVQDTGVLRCIGMVRSQ